MGRSIIDYNIAPHDETTFQIYKWMFLIKCRCMAIGKLYNAVISPLRIGNLQIEWSNCIKYLGV